MNSIKIHKKSLSPFCTFKDEVWMVKHGPPTLCSFYAVWTSKQKHQVLPIYHAAWDWKDYRMQHWTSPNRYVKATG